MGSKEEEKVKEILINTTMKWTVYQVHWIWRSLRVYHGIHCFTVTWYVEQRKFRHSDPSALCVLGCYLSGRKKMDLARHNIGKNTELWCAVVVFMKRKEMYSGCATITERFINYRKRKQCFWKMWTYNKHNRERKIPLGKLYGNHLKQSISM